ncbi:MAG TPA: hypothetical protein ENF54_01030 [Desulfobacteraceae bacterium]|nr:hypothetical protein [Desulfobacteraceae bacterium]
MFWPFKKGINLKKIIPNSFLIKQKLIKIRGIISVIIEQISQSVKKIEESTLDVIDNFTELVRNIEKNADLTISQKDILKQNLSFELCKLQGFKLYSKNGGRLCERHQECKLKNSCVLEDGIKDVFESLRIMIKNSENEMRSFTEKISSYVDKFNEMAERMKDINKLSNDISELARTTNIVALNATIEAARAGEKGLGFGVIAGEVKRLADRSSEFAKKVRDNLSEVVNFIKIFQEEFIEILKKQSESLEGNGSILSGLMNSLSDVHSSFDKFINKANEIKEAINNIIFKLQFEDITKQISQHVIEALRSIEDELMDMGGRRLNRIVGEDQIKDRLLKDLEKSYTIRKERHVAKKVLKEEFPESDQGKEEEEGVTFF